MENTGVEVKKKSHLDVIGLILGIIGVLLSCIMLGGFVGIAGIVVCCYGLKNKDRKLGILIAGFGLNILAVIFAIVMFIVVIFSEDTMQDTNSSSQISVTDEKEISSNIDSETKENIESEVDEAKEIFYKYLEDNKNKYYEQLKKFDKDIIDRMFISYCTEVTESQLSEKQQAEKIISAYETIEELVKSERNDNVYKWASELIEMEEKSRSLNAKYNFEITELYDNMCNAPTGSFYVQYVLKNAYEDTILGAIAKNLDSLSESEYTCYYANNVTYDDLWGEWYGEEEYILSTNLPFGSSGVYEVCYMVTGTEKEVVDNKGFTRKIPILEVVDQSVFHELCEDKREYDDSCYAADQAYDQMNGYIKEEKIENTNQKTTSTKSQSTRSDTSEDIIKLEDYIYLADSGEDLENILRNAGCDTVIGKKIYFSNVDLGNGIEIQMLPNAGSKFSIYGITTNMSMQEAEDILSKKSNVRAMGEAKDLWCYTYDARYENDGIALEYLIDESYTLIISGNNKNGIMISYLGFPLREELSSEIIYDSYYYDYPYAGLIAEYNSMYPNSSDYTLHDIDEDGIEELIVSYGTCNADWTNSVYTLIDNEVYWLGDFYGCVAVYDSDYCIYSVYEHMDYVSIEYICVDGYNLYTENMEGSVEVGAELLFTSTSDTSALY